MTGPRAALALLAAAGLSGCGGAGPEPGMDRDSIMAIIAQESPILYRDGQTRIGVLFDSEHRVYVPYEKIPEAWVQAITAAEDQRFFSHPGVDPLGISRAMWANLKAGRVVAGGSTLTQQTAKNLFYRPDRSWRSKVAELELALELESAFSKEDILEFYANQFHVSANGRGLAIAARYFFDKDLTSDAPDQQLTTLECAFLAGLVKAPASYNPFTGATEERRAAARARARARTGYVLDRMLDLGHLTGDEHARLKAEEIPFKRGTFRYDSSVLIDEVAARLEEHPFPEVFAALGIDNPSTAGIQVVTTLDAVAQAEATHGLWHHLTEVGPALEGPGPDALRLPEAAAPGPEGPPPVRGFGAARVLRSEPSGMTLDLGGLTCEVDRTGMDRMAATLASAASATLARSGDRGRVADALPPGSVTWASRRDPTTCDLELRPALQGGLIALDQGQIRLMVGGNDNRDFNRAVHAQRQLGSTWKPLVYWTALQLGWAPTDLLDNREAVFGFEGTWYAPRPDHEPADVVSLSQAGIASENIASIWLLQHLLDDLDPATFRELAARVGLDPAAAGAGWIPLVRDTYGVIATPARAGEVAFTAAKLELLAELPRPMGSSGIPERIELQALLHGAGTVREERSLDGEPRADARRRALRFNHLRLSGLLPACDAAASALAAVANPTADAGPPTPAAFSALRVAEAPDGGLRLGCGEVAEPGWRAVDDALLTAIAAGAAVPTADEVWLDGRLRAGLVRRLERVRQRRELVVAGQDPYSLEVLQHHPDFRTLVSLRLIATWASRLGVKAELPPVLSLPLGAAELSLEEAAGLYEGILVGGTWRFPGEVWVDGESRPAPSPDRPTLLISKILDARGAVLYEASSELVPIADPSGGLQIADVLRNVVLHGTGRRAASAVQLGEGRVPVGGKTGTTNGFKNAAFVGFVPRAAAMGWEAVGGVTVAAYVGYDDNTPMSRGKVRLAGASGALPAWLGAAQGVASAGLIGVAPKTGPAELRVIGGMSRVSLTGDGQGRPTPDLDTGKSALVAGAGLLVDGSVDLERRITLPPRPGEAPAPVAWSPGAPPGGPAAGAEDVGDDVEVVIRPDEAP